METPRPLTLAGSNYSRVILTAQSLYTNLNYPEIPDSWINLIYLHINHLHYLNKVLLSIHRNKQRRESNAMNEYDLAKSLNEK